MVNDHHLAGVEEVRRHKQREPQHTGEEDTQKEMQTTRKQWDVTNNLIPQTGRQTSQETSPERSRRRRGMEKGRTRQDLENTEIQIYLYL
jgi:hypothetical protein